jgi:drug/metabolite transporter (DMT)-like permease
MIGRAAPRTGSTPAGAPAGVHASTGERSVAEAAALLVAVIWAANFIVVKAANAEIPPVTFAAMRFGLASILLFGMLRLREGSIGLPAEVRWWIVGLGVLGFGAYQVLWTTGLRSIPAGNSALIVASAPVITAIVAGMVGADTITRRKLLGALVSFLGVAVVIVEGGGVDLGASLGGNLLSLAAAACWAVYTALASPYLARISSLRLIAWATLAGTAALIPLGVAQGIPVDWGAVSGGAWLGFAYSAILPAAISNVLVFNAIRLLGPARITAYQFLVPFFALVIGALFLAEPIVASQVLGGAVIVAGVLVTRSGRART